VRAPSSGFTIATTGGSGPSDGSWWSVTIVSTPRSARREITSWAEVPLSTLITSFAPVDSARAIECSPNE